MHFYITVQSPQSLGGTVYLKLSYFVLRIQYLALQVADTDRIIVRQTYCTYSCTCKIEGGRGAKSACAYYQNSCLMQFSCPPSPISGREICLLYRVMMRIINYEKGFKPVSGRNWHPSLSIRVRVLNSLRLCLLLRPYARR